MNLVMEPAVIGAIKLVNFLVKFILLMPGSKGFKIFTFTCPHVIPNLYNTDIIQNILSSTEQKCHFN